MSTATELAPIVNGHTAPTSIDFATLEKLVVGGDLSKLSSAERVQWYLARCDAAKVDHRTQPFQYLTLNGKLTLYATKTCSDQLIERRNLTAEIVENQFLPDLNIYQVVCRVKRPDGTFVDDLAAVNVKGLYGDALCNALMKCTTKAKRRAVLSACGLGMSDDTELDTIPGAAIEGTFKGLAPLAKPIVEVVPADSGPSLAQPWFKDIPPGQGAYGPPDNDSGYGRGQYASPEQCAAYQGECRAYVAQRNAAWLDTWQLRGIEATDLCHTMQLTRHLLKWGLKEGKLANVPFTFNPETGEQTEKVSTEQAMKYVAILHARDSNSLWAEAERYVNRIAKAKTMTLDPGSVEADAGEVAAEAREPGSEG